MESKHTLQMWQRAVVHMLRHTHHSAARFEGYVMNNEHPQKLYKVEEIYYNE
jgi:hypothetical protein